MATRFVWNGLSAVQPAANPAQAPLFVNRRPVVAYDAGATIEGIYFDGVAPQGLTGALTLVVSYFMASATSGGVRLRASVEAITSGDATDLDAATSFDTANSASDTGVPGTAGLMEQISITLTTNDSLAAADYFRIFLERETTHADDTATGDMYVAEVELRDAA